ncbi:MAG: universal stress protein [Acidobacteriota bacterium]|nr:MAG: universal stress protein [Acidobacteriota bacterium]
MKLLIAYDGSDCANAAIQDMRRAGLPDKCEVVVFSVAEVWLPPPSSFEILGKEVAGTLDERKRKAHELADQAAGRLRKLFPSWEVVSIADTGSPAGMPLEYAEKFGPDLLMVGSHGFSTLERIALGSVSQRVVTEARCSVRVARGRVEEDMDTPVRILVAIDGSEDAARAADEVIRRNWPAGSQVKLITCVGPHLEKHEPAIVTSVTAPVAEMLDGLAVKMRAAGLDVATKVSLEDPKRAIIDEAESWGADSIFVGSRGLGRITRFFLGSVSSAVTARAHCSVEVVR